MKYPIRFLLNTIRWFIEPPDDDDGPTAWRLLFVAIVMILAVFC